MFTETWRPRSSHQEESLKKVRQLERESLLPTELGRRLKPNACLPPELYGHPEFHKLDVPLRPIMLSIGSPIYQLSKHITELITPLTGQTGSFVRISKHLVEMLRGVQLQPEEVMVSSKITSNSSRPWMNAAVNVILSGCGDNSCTFYNMVWTTENGYSLCVTWQSESPPKMESTLCCRHGVHAQCCWNSMLHPLGSPSSSHHTHCQ